MQNSKIQWCDHTFNPWLGCTKVSPGCTNCYAEALMDKRFGRVEWGPAGTRVRTSEANWRKPLTWNRDEWRGCPACGWRGSVQSVRIDITDKRPFSCPDCGRAHPNTVRQRVFCSSLADVFEDRPELYQWREDLFALIDKTPNLDWLLLTKRPENANDMITTMTGGYLNAGDWDNLWIGTSVENQEQADKRIPELLKIPAAVRFLSVEPLLGPMTINKETGTLDEVFALGENGINWVIVGGESGPNARPMHPDWVRGIRDQCQAAGVPFLFKQWGEWLPYGQDGEADDVSMYGKGTVATLNGHGMQRIGKHAAGRLLDGREWNEFPG